MSLSILSNPLSSNNEYDFFKRKFAIFNSLERQLKDYYYIDYYYSKSFLFHLVPSPLPIFEITFFTLKHLRFLLKKLL